MWKGSDKEACNLYCKLCNTAEKREQMKKDNEELKKK